MGYKELFSDIYHDPTQNLLLDPKLLVATNTLHSNLTMLYQTGPILVMWLEHVVILKLQLFIHSMFQHKLGRTIVFVVCLHISYGY